MSLPRILVVEDDEATGLLVKALLQNGSELEVEVVPDAESALMYIEAEPPDLILLDIVMPGLNGFDVLHNLRGRPETRPIPVVVVTGLDGPDDAVRCLDAGADDFVAKPFRRGELVARVRSHLRVKSLRDELEAEKAGLARHARSLEAAAEERRRRVARVAEDLRTPVAALHVGLEGLRRRVDPVDLPVAAAHLEVLQGCAATLERLAREMGEAAGLSEADLPARPEPFAPGALLAAAVREAGREAGRCGKRVVLHMAETLPMVVSDPRLVARTVATLVTHAVAMSRDKGEVEVTADLGDGVLEVSVADAGAELPPDLRARILDGAGGRRSPGERARRATEVFSCRTAVEALGGRIWVEPRRGDGGTLYRFEVPAPLAP